jgi:hypothetical protein
MHAFDDKLRNSQCRVASLAAARAWIAEHQHTRFILKNASHSFVAKIPHPCDLRDGVMANCKARELGRDLLRATHRHECCCARHRSHCLAFKRPPPKPNLISLRITHSSKTPEKTLKFTWQRNETWLVTCFARAPPASPSPSFSKSPRGTPMIFYVTLPPAT